jgi:hypothetical protein
MSFYKHNKKRPQLPTPIRVIDGGLPEPPPPPEGLTANIAVIAGLFVPCVKVATVPSCRSSTESPDLFRAACRMGLEGLVSKRRDRPYRAG